VTITPSTNGDKINPSLFLSQVKKDFPISSENKIGTGWLSYKQPFTYNRFFLENTLLEYLVAIDLIFYDLLYNRELEILNFI
jgi:hypothetical protein